jgi:BolA protein
MTEGPVASSIMKTLTTTFPNADIRLEDQSHMHAGHAGARAEGETHFRVTAISPAFDGKSRIDRHRMINVALKELLASRVHALAIVALTPAEAQAKGMKE